MSQTSCLDCYMSWRMPVCGLPKVYFRVHSRLIPKLHRPKTKHCFIVVWLPWNFFVPLLWAELLISHFQRFPICKFFRVLPSSAVPCINTLCRKCHSNSRVTYKYQQIFFQRQTFRPAWHYIVRPLKLEKYRIIFFAFNKNTNDFIYIYIYWFYRRHNKFTRFTTHNFIVLIVRLLGLKHNFAISFGFSWSHH
jgi:hypothetical protein